MQPTKRKFLIVGGLLVLAVAALVFLYRDYLYEEYVIDPLGRAKLIHNLAASQCPDHVGADTSEGWRFSVNVDHCYEFDAPLDWMGTQYLNEEKRKYEAVASEQFVDASDQFTDETTKWDFGWEYTVEIETTAASITLGDTPTLEAFIDRQSTTYRDRRSTTLGGQPAFKVLETLPGELPHEVILCEYRGKVVLLRIGAGEFDKSNRADVDRLIASFRFLSEFGQSSQ